MTKSVIRRHLEHLILEEHSRAQGERIIHYIGKDKQKIEALMTCFLEGSGVVPQRSAAVVGKLEEYQHDVLNPYYAQLIEHLAAPDLHHAVIRNTLRVFENKQLKDDLAGQLMDHCFRFLEDNTYPVAIHAFSITCIFNQARPYPEIMHELKLLIEPQIEFSRPAYRYRALEVLKWMSK